VLLRHIEVFLIVKHQNLNFWWYSKFLEPIVYGQILAILGNFRQS
jgi:hypothetical protein